MELKNEGFDWYRKAIRQEQLFNKIMFTVAGCFVGTLIGHALPLGSKGEIW